MTDSRDRTPPAFSRVPHFQDVSNPERSPADEPPCRLPEASYGLALDHLVITCVDVVPVEGESVLLVNRVQDPKQGWWLIGGRMTVGEDPVETAHRKLRAEARLPLALHRFLLTGVYSTRFARRCQPPQENGAHTVNLTYAISLSPRERSTMQFNPSEHDRGVWVPVSRVRELLDLSQPMDQCLLQVIQDVQTTLKVGGGGDRSR